MMYLKSSIITFLFMLVVVLGITQTGVHRNGETKTVNGSKYISAHTRDKDTLYLADNTMGHDIKKVWEMSGMTQKPHIIVVDPERIAKLEVKRDGVIVHKEYQNRNK